MSLFGKSSKRFTPEEDSIYQTVQNQLSKLPTDDGKIVNGDLVKFYRSSTERLHLAIVVKYNAEHTMGTECISRLRVVGEKDTVGQLYKKLIRVDVDSLVL